ncbi:hypothetical protein POL68_13305 [Stigmatella sp. ncwal1]|uniref:Uncharacterized protein n=1 Tax=Stigmatella ashevillensis TaxID=2995309 RepID=A0ABT5DAQ6_9BACT|nr:hypothetical protein [Stigmatella ashevillena]MDC0709442.1 hypothetical protein [Stigmatella ashevillena]
MIHPSQQGVRIQPLPIFYECHDYHVILFLDGHPEYESVEAMISENEDGGAVVRAIITLLDKRQVDHINDAGFSRLGTKREIHCTPVRYERSVVGGRTRIRIGFESFQEEDIHMELEAASAAAAEHACLIDPLGHSRRLSLPVMCPERVAPLGPAGRIHISSRQTRSRAAAGTSHAFKGKTGFYAENFRIGVLRASTGYLRIEQEPSRLEVGEQWVYESGGSTLRYVILGVRGNLLCIQGRNELLSVEVMENGLALRTVSSISSSKERKDSSYSIAFSPGLPISPSIDGMKRRSESHFSISIDEQSALVTGKAASEQGEGKVKLVLMPVEPHWASERTVSTSILDAEGGLMLDTDISP